jgi:hypothetical protein
MKQSALSTHRRSLGGFEIEDMIYPCIYGCADGAHVYSYSKSPVPSG